MSDKELFSQLETILAESKDFFNFVPISSMVGTLWNNDEYKIPVICTIGKTMMRFQINGETFDDIQKHFVENLQIEEPFAASCYNFASVAGPYCADIMDGIMTRDEAIEELKKEFGKNAELAEPMVKSLMELVDHGPVEDFVYQKPEDIKELTPLKMDLHRQLAEFYFEEANRPLASLIMALTQDYLDGTPIYELRDSLKKDLGPQAEGIIQNVIEVSERPSGVWVEVIKQIKAFEV